MLIFENTILFVKRQNYHSRCIYTCGFNYLGCRGFMARSIQALLSFQANIACSNKSTVKCSTGVTKPLEEVSKV
jgi:hypothetical protein